MKVSVQEQFPILKKKKKKKKFYRKREIAINFF